MQAKTPFAFSASVRKTRKLSIRNRKFFKKYTIQNRKFHTFGDTQIQEEEKKSN